MLVDTPTCWDLISDGPLPGPMNMAIDEVLLKRSNRHPVLRFYQWDRPTLSLGMSQPIERHVNLNYCKQASIPVIRRITGGKAVLHSHELTYSLSGSVESPPFNLDLMESYKAIGHAFLRAFHHLGINAELASRDSRPAGGSVTSCFECPSAYEILVDGKKLLGSAQKRTKERVLQHGSLLIDYDESEWSAAMLRTQRKTSDTVISMRMLLDHGLRLETILQAIREGFEEYFGITFKLCSLTEAEWELARKLGDTVYRDNAALLDSEVV